MPSCALCHLQDPKTASRVTISNVHSWSLITNTMLQINQRICTKHLDKNNKPTLHLQQKKLSVGLDGKYWKIDRKKGRYNIINKPITSEQQLFLTIIINTNTQLQEQQQYIQTIQTSHSTSLDIDIIDERYIFVFFRIIKYKDYPLHIHNLLGIPSWNHLITLTNMIKHQLPQLRLDIQHEDVVAFVLMRLRRGLPHSSIAALYNTSASRTTELGNIALELLATQLKNNIKLLSKQDMINHTPISLQQQYPNAKIYICDDTYIYIQHSDDLDIQHETFSNHKYRNLVKFFIGCAPNGTILTAEGPYFADSDDEILQTSLNDGVNAWL